jgi:hypothetical protein
MEERTTITPPCRYRLRAGANKMDPLDPHKGSVADSREGECVDPGEKGAILETGRPGPPERGKERQLAQDSRGEGT